MPNCISNIIKRIYSHKVREKFQKLVVVKVVFGYFVCRFLHHFWCLQISQVFRSRTPLRTNVMCTHFFVSTRDAQMVFRSEPDKSEENCAWKIVKFLGLKRRRKPYSFLLKAGSFGSGSNIDRISWLLPIVDGKSTEYLPKFKQVLSRNWHPFIVHWLHFFSRAIFS